MRMNSKMAARWARVEDRTAAAPLAVRLRELSSSALIRVADAVVLGALYDQGRGAPGGDPTGFEAEVNKIHLPDFIGEVDPDHAVAQGVQYARELASRLAQLGGSFRLLLSLDTDSGEVTVRFFGRRGGLPWGAEDPEQYRLEEVAQWDV